MCERGPSAASSGLQGMDQQISAPSPFGMALVLIFWQRKHLKLYLGIGFEYTYSQ
jgi:hypothetical protein